MPEKSFKDISRRDFLISASSGIMGIGLEACSPESKSRKTPEARTFTEIELGEYIKGKRVVLFGGSHDPNYTKDAQTFIGLIPQIKAQGFTHIALELDRERHQRSVDQYLETGNDAKITKEISPYIDGIKELSIIKAIKMSGQRTIKIICYDDRQLKNFHGLTDEQNRQQFFAEREDHGYQTIEKVLEQNPQAKIVIYTNELHVQNFPVSTFQFGNQKDGSPILVQLEQPLGYRFKKQYGNMGGVGIVDLTKPAPTEVR